MKKKIISILLTIVMLIGIMPSGGISVFAAAGVKYLEYNTSTGAFDERTCTDYTTLADGVTTWTGGWYVAPAGKLELGEVNVNGSAYLILTNGCELIVNGGIHINNGSSLTIYAQSEGENAGNLVANGGQDVAGIGSTHKGSCGNITINGGNITATSGRYGAGIGSGYNGSCCGNITINGGNITANGGNRGSGIGSGCYDSSCNNIIINGGNITANGSARGAGIGSGLYGSCDSITINGGTIVAKGGTPDIDKSAGVGIGSGYEGSCGNIIINGGDVTAIGADSIAQKFDYGGNGIGNSYYGTCGKVIINGGNIAAAGGSVSTEDSVCGKPFNAEVVLGEHVCVSDRFNGEMLVSDNIGTKNYCDSFNALAENDYRKRPVSAICAFENGLPDNVIKYYECYEELGIALTKYKVIDSATPITSETRSLTSGWYKADGAVTVSETLAVTGDVHLILNDGCTLKVTGGIKVESGNSLSIYPEYDGSGQLVTSGYYGVPGIGGFDGDAGDITIHGGNITATGGLHAAGIGGGNSKSGGNVTICGGSVTANGSSDGAGIGGGDYGHGGTVNIYGGSVTANGGDQGAGIGSGHFGNGGTVTIYGGNVTANGGGEGAGIGGSFGDMSNNGGNVYIYGGNINAVGGFHAAGIGGGNGTNGADIHIGGGSIIATGGEGCSAFGCGYNKQQDLPVGEIYLSANTSLYNGRDGSVINGNWYQDQGSSGYLSYIGPVNNTAVKDEQGRNKVYVYAIPDVTKQIQYLEYLEYNTSTEKFERKSIAENKVFSIFGPAQWDAQWYEVDGNETVDGTITVKGDVNLILKDGCKLEVKGGIKVSGENSLTIYAQSDGENMGRLIADSNSGTAVISGVAGIGGAANTTYAKITIHGGNITATGSENGAGIGGGDHANGNVTIYSGIITATGGNNGAGIGGGNYAGGDVTIYSGNITATGGNNGAGIGGGDHANGNVTIYSGDITATGGNYAAGIGGGDYASGDVTIHDGDITATGGESGAGIGGGIFAGSDSNITIYNGTISATGGGGDGAAGIGGGAYYSGNVTIYNGDITATGSDGGAGIGGGLYAGGGEVTVYDGKITATGSNKAAGIGGGNGGESVYIIRDGGDIAIHGGDITATGSYGAAGIGGGYNENGGTVTVNGGKIIATGGEDAAGIGGGYYHLYYQEEFFGTFGDGGKVTVNGGNITATGKGNGAGIGGGRYANGNTFTMTGGVVSATGVHGAGIGGGYYGYGSEFTFSGGSVTACSEYAAGIGAGEEGGVSAYANRGFNVADGSIVKAGDTAANSSVTTATTYAQNRYKFASVHLHDYTGGYKDNGDGTHLRQCAYCDVVGTPEEHTFVNHECVCGATNNHDFTGEYKDNGDGTHSRKCTECDEYGTPENHTFTYTVNDSTVTAECSGCDAQVSMTLTVPELPIYDGNKKTATLEGRDEFTALTGAVVGNILYSEDGGSTYSENAPVNTGNYYVKAAVADKELTAQFTIRKAGLTTDDFTFIPPANCEYDGQAKQASVTTDKTGMGNITVKYQKKNGSDWDTATTDAPTEVGKYRVVISVEEGTNYAASATDITSDSWVFEITAPPCTHENTTVSYKWNDTYTECTATEHCNDCNEDIQTEKTTEIELIEDTHGANCKTKGKGHYKATFATLGTAETASEFDTTYGDHHYVDYVCEYCGDELLEDAKSDAIKAINDAEDHSEDEVVKLLAETAEAAIHNAQSVAEVIALRNRYVSAIEQLTGEAHEHTFSTDWNFDETKHWHEATCKHTSLTENLGEHTFDENGKCTVCGYEKEASELDEAKTAAKAEIDEAVDGASDAIKGYAATAKANIDACTSITELVGVYTAELNKINKMKTKEAIDAATKELEELDVISSKAKKIVKSVKPLLATASSPAEVNAIMTQTLAGIDEAEAKVTDTDRYLVNKLQPEVGNMMGRQTKIGDESKGRVIIPVTQEQLEKIGDKLVIVGGDFEKETTIEIDCAYTYFYDGETKIEAKDITVNEKGDKAYAFIIIDCDAEHNPISGYGYYRLYNESVSTENFLFDVIYADPKGYDE